MPARIQQRADQSQPIKLILAMGRLCDWINLGRHSRPKGESQGCDSSIERTVQFPNETKAFEKPEKLNGEKKWWPGAD